MKVQRYMSICQFLVVDLNEIKIIRLGLLLLKLGLSPLILLQTYLFLKKFELNYFVQYAPLYIVVLYTLMCVFSQSYITDKITKKVNGIQIWKIEDAPEEIQEKMKKIWFIVTLCIFLSIVSSCVIFIAYTVPTPQDNDFIFTFKLANMYLPQWETPIVWCLIKPAVFGLTYLGLSTPAFAIYYYHGHISLQKYMLKHHLRNINPKSSSANYHQEVNEKLLFCVRNHTHLVKCGFKILGRAQVFVFPFRVAGISFLAGIVLLCFTFEGSLSSQYFRLVAHLLSAIIILVGTVVSGQGIEDLSPEIADALCEVDWCDWDQRNKRIYLTFLTSTNKVFKIKYSDNISLNYELGIQIIKAVFSAMSIIYSLQRQKMN